MLGRAGRTDEAIQEFQTALRLAPDAATTHFNLANLLVKQRAQDEAMAHYSEALRLAKAAGEDDFAESIRARIALYKKGLPFGDEK